MFFIASKLFNVMAQPFSVAILLLVFAWLFFEKNPVMAKRIIGGALVLFFLCGTAIFTDSILSIFEQRVSRAEIPDDIDGIIVLVGMVDVRCSRKGLVELSESADRIVQGVVLARQYPKAKLIITGGSCRLDQDDCFREADYLNKLVLALGIEKERIVIERNARYTYEHAKNLSSMLSKDGVWVLVTSAFHMPRSIGCFKKAGFTVKAYPVDYRTKSKMFCEISLESFMPKPSNFQKFSIALHEGIGLIAYRLLGYTDAVLPI